jgi:hypothetical protein
MTDFDNEYVAEEYNIEITNDLLSMIYNSKQKYYILNNNYINNKNISKKLINNIHQYILENKYYKDNINFEDWCLHNENNEEDYDDYNYDDDISDSESEDEYDIGEDVYYDEYYSFS